MAFQIGSVVAKLSLDLNNFKNGVKDAKNETNNLSSHLKKVGSGIADFGKKSAVFTGALATGFTLVTKNAIESASSFEQNRIAFETMLGSADRAKKLLKDISDFAIKTPFNLPQLVDGAQRLLAYNIEGEKVVETLDMLGNITAGVGTEKLPQLILAFGQVKAATKLTGAELRQFSEAGVPLLEALVNQANEAGGVLTKVGGASKETTKKIASLASSIANTEFEMNYFKETGGKTEKQLASMQQKLDLNKAKLEEFGEVGQAVYKRVKVTAEEMIDSISDGSIKFEDVEKALKGMTSEGGKFFNLMEKQSLTFGGIVSNIQDQIGRMMRTMVGISEEGDIAENSVFSKVKYGAEQLLGFLDIITPKMSGKIGEIMESASYWFNRISEALKPFGEWIKENKDLVITFLKGMGIALTAILVIGTVTTLLTALLNPLVWVSVAIAALYTAWQTNFLGIQDITKTVFNWFMEVVNNTIIPFIKTFIDYMKTNWDDWKIYFEFLWSLIYGIIKIYWSIISGFILTALEILSGDWKGAWDRIYKMVEGVWGGIVIILLGALDFIVGWGKQVVEKFVSPFRDAWNQINELVNKIKDKLDFTQRHSPSVIDIIDNSVKQANKALSGLKADFDINAKSMVQSMGGNNIGAVNVYLPNAVISNMNEAQNIGVTIGDSIISQLKKNVRV